MIMRGVVKFVSGIVLLLTVVTVYGDALHNYSRALDRAERNFWLVMMGRTDAARDNYKRTLTELKNIAAEIDHMEYLKGLRRSRAALSNNVSVIDSLLSRQLPSFRRISISSSSMMNSSVDVYRAKLARARKRSTKLGPIPYEELTLENYRNYLQTVRDSNVRTVESRIRNNRNMSGSAKETLIQITEAFYTAVGELRYRVLQMRQQHPLFKKKKQKSILD